VLERDPARARPDSEVLQIVQTVVFSQPQYVQDLALKYQERKVFRPFEGEVDALDTPWI
jgi:hypothetical protein